jgi:hypothetical protein
MPFPLLFFILHFALCILHLLIGPGLPHLLSAVNMHLNHE